MSNMKQNFIVAHLHSSGEDISCWTEEGDKLLSNGFDESTSILRGDSHNMEKNVLSDSDEICIDSDQVNVSEIESNLKEIDKSSIDNTIERRVTFKRSVL